jgi:CBS domain containing-hemolysin-like protein/mannitol/fructose-specific phosphotransferase system IIA component (Ntr-type)
MILAIYLLIAGFLLVMNGFFVLAEFAMVKARPTLIEALAAKGIRRARTVKLMQANLDEFLSVCQVGITLASIGLGFIGEPAFAQLLEPVITWVGVPELGAAITAHAVAIAIAYALVSYLHIVIGELLPKSVGIRKTERMVFLTAVPMMVFRYIFIAPIWVLNSTVNAILRIFKLPPVTGPGAHTEDELRVILDHSQTSGMLSFKQLLHIENVFDMGALTVRNAMRVKRHVRSLFLGMSRLDIDRVISENRFSRYPVLDAESAKPLGFIHIKDLFLAERAGRPTDDLRQFIKTALQAREDDPLEPLLSEMQRKACHMSFVFTRDGTWSGIITLEDALEEVIGTIEEEYPVEAPVRLSDLISPERTFLDVEGDSILSATRSTLQRVKPEKLPMSREAIMHAVSEREKLASSYIGRRLAIPHARLKGISAPMVIVSRLKTPFPAPIQGEEVSLIFLLVTPADLPRIHQLLLSHIAGIFESDFLEGRLETAANAAELYSVICTAEQVVLG